MAAEGSRVSIRLMLKCPVSVQGSLLQLLLYEKHLRRLFYKRTKAVSGAQASEEYTIKNQIIAAFEAMVLKDTTRNVYWELT